VQLAHAADDRLPGLRVLVDVERRILVGQLLEAEVELLLSACVFGSMARAITGLGDVDALRMMGALGLQIVSPVPASRRPMATTIVPAPERSLRSRLLA
jgi:hypothetical protein